MYDRHITQNILDALKDTPVVLLNGARQTGKSTLVQTLAGNDSETRYFTLDDASVLSAAKADPQGLVSTFPGNLVIDEVQRVPDLFLAIKAEVDRDRRPGRFLLTGSANVLLLPKLSESLAGRMEILTLWPLSRQEISGRRRNVVDALFSREVVNWPVSELSREGLIQALVLGGYPESQRRSSESRRHAWFNSYVTSLLERDIRDLANIDGLTEMPRLLSLLAARSASLLNISELSRSAGIPLTTLRRYLTLLEATFLIAPISSWSRNEGKRFVKAPKIFLNDTGLMADLLGYGSERLMREPGMPGHLLETFVHGELKKHAGWSNTSVRMLHYRTSTGFEVDFVLESRQGDIVGVEVKASSTLRKDDWSGLRHLREEASGQFRHGYILYRGTSILPFGQDLTALPIGLFF